MYNSRSQSGMSFIVMLIIACMFGFFVMCAIRMTPKYLEYLTIQDVVSKIATEPKAEDQSVAAIRRRIATAFNTNQVYGLQPREVEVYREDGNTYIDANYEARINVLSNIDVIMRFEDLTYIAGQELE